MASKPVKIIRGPSQWDIIIKGLVEQEPVTLTLDGGREVEVTIRGCSNEFNWDTVTPEDEEYGRVGGWLIEGEQVSTKEEAEAETDFIFYASYDTSTRTGLYRTEEHSPNGPHHEKLRYKWGDLVQGDDSWRF